MVLPNYIQYRYDLYRQKKADRALRKNPPPDSEQAHENGDIQQYVHELELSEQWRAIIQTDYYRRKAEALLVQMPPEDDASMYSRVGWDDHHDMYRYLTPLGLRTVRASIREEQKHRRDVLGFWIAGVTGLGGIVIGIISVWPKK